MAVGGGQDINSINSWAATISLELERAFTQVQEYKTFLDATGSAGLQAAGLSASDAATLISAFNDAATLGNIYRGTATQATTYDFRTFLKQLRGVSCW